MDFDYSTNQLQEGFHLLAKRGELEFKTTDLVVHHGAQLEDLPVTPIPEAIDYADVADLIVFSSGGNMDFCNGPLRKILFNPKFKDKRIFVDGHDSNQKLIDPQYHLAYFKREHRWPECVQHIHPNMRSLTFGVYNYLYESSILWDDLSAEYDRRDIDISFIAFGGSNDLRKKCEIVLKQANEQHGIRTYAHVQQDGQPIPLEKYHEILYRSKAGVSVPGAGLDTLRYWETPAHGAILVSFDLTNALWVRNQFEHMRNAIFFRNWDNMLEWTYQVVSNKQRWMQMRHAANNHLKYHTTIARAREVIEACKELLLKGL